MQNQLTGQPGNRRRNNNNNDSDNDGSNNNNDNDGGNGNDKKGPPKNKFRKLLQAEGLGEDAAELCVASGGEFVLVTGYVSIFFQPACTSRLSHRCVQ